MLKNKEEVIQKISERISRVKGSVKLSTITEETDLMTDLNFNSLELIDLQFELEDAFNMSIDIRALTLQGSAKAQGASKLTVAMLLDSMNL